MEKNIKELMHKTEEEMKRIFLNIASQLRGEDKSAETAVALDELINSISIAINEAINNENNTFEEHSEFYTAYFRMRRSQCLILQSINRGMVHKDYDFDALPEFLEEISGTISAKNSADYRFERLAKVSAVFESQPVPENKSDFGDVAFIYYIIKELEGFLRLKQKFYNDLSDEQRKLYLGI
jgi:uncharacterized membrane protein YgaE (UPF0421/DUF939 family)